MNTLLLAIETILPLECADFFWGDNCSQTCNCFNGGHCSSDDGFCDEGCPQWFLGDNCQTGKHQPITSIEIVFQNIYQ